MFQLDLIGSKYIILIKMLDSIDLFINLHKDSCVSFYIQGISEMALET